MGRVNRCLDRKGMLVIHMPRCGHWLTPRFIQLPYAHVPSALAQQRRVDGRAVQVRRLRRGDALAGAHILFVAASELERLAAAQESLRAAAVLTVTDGSQPPQPAGIVNFVVRDNRLRFEIDAEAAEAAHLRISSKVLALAVSVKGARQR